MDPRWGRVIHQTLPLPFLTLPTRKGLGTKLAISLVPPTAGLGTRLIDCMHGGHSEGELFLHKQLLFVCDESFPVDTAK